MEVVSEQHPDWMESPQSRYRARHFYCWLKYRWPGVTPLVTSEYQPRLWAEPSGLKTTTGASISVLLAADWSPSQILLCADNQSVLAQLTEGNPKNSGFARNALTVVDLLLKR